VANGAVLKSDMTHISSLYTVFCLCICRCV